MQVVEGTQEYDIRANWKLLVENSFDDYHLLTTHKTWLDYMKDSGVNVEPPAGQGLLLPSGAWCLRQGEFRLVESRRVRFFARYTNQLAIPVTGPAMIKQL